MDDIIENSEVPDDVKKDAIRVKERQTEVKEGLYRKREELEKAKNKIAEFDEIRDGLMKWTEATRTDTLFTEPIANNVEKLKQQLRSVEVLIWLLFTFEEWVYKWHLLSTQNLYLVFCDGKICKYHREYDCFRAA